MPTHIVDYLYQPPYHFINTHHPTPNTPKLSILFLSSGRENLFFFNTSKIQITF